MSDAKLFDEITEALESLRKTRKTLLEIHGVLHAALIQRSDSDDAIIMGHVAEADRLVLEALSYEP